MVIPDFDLGQSTVVVVTTELSKRLSGIFFTQIRLGKDRVVPPNGMLVHRMRNKAEEEFVRAINLGDVPKSYSFNITGPSKFELAPREARLLPINVTIDDFPISSSTAEIVRREPGKLTFRGAATETYVCVRYEAPIKSSHGTVELYAQSLWIVTIPGGVDEFSIEHAYGVHPENAECHEHS